MLSEDYGELWRRSRKSFAANFTHTVRDLVEGSGLDQKSAVVLGGRNGTSATGTRAVVKTILWTVPGLIKLSEALVGGSRGIHTHTTETAHCGGDSLELVPRGEGAQRTWRCMVETTTRSADPRASCP